MTIEPIGATGVVLYLTPADLEQWGCSADSLTLQQALTLTREVCAGAGIPLEGAGASEADPECCGVLVFAHTKAQGPLWFIFDGLEALMEAALVLHGTPVDAGLWWREGKYYLALPSGAEGAAQVCGEYGGSYPQGFRPEQGRLIFSHYALAHLVRHFLRLHL